MSITNLNKVLFVDLIHLLFKSQPNYVFSGFKKISRVFEASFSADPNNVKSIESLLLL